MTNYFENRASIDCQDFFAVKLSRTQPQTAIISRQLLEFDFLFFIYKVQFKRQTQVNYIVFFFHKFHLHILSHFLIYGNNTLILHRPARCLFMSWCYSCSETRNEKCI